MALSRAYIRSPNLDFVPGGPIRLGHILENPYRPSKPLFTIEPPPTVTVPHFTYEINHNGGHTMKAEFLSKLFGAGGVNLDAGLTDNSRVSYTMDSLETTYFAADPTDDEAEELAKNEKVKRVLSRLPRRPVYMITGLKIAKGLRYRTEEDARQNGNLGGQVQATAQVSVGAEVGGSRETTLSEGFTAGCDVIVAYRLHMIARKSWWKAEVEAEPYQSKFGFLGTDKRKEQGKQEALAAQDATVEELIESAALFEVDCGEPVEACVGEESFVVIPVSD